MNLITRISNRVDTTKNWSEKNPILLYGEFGIEFTENNETRLKVGNGEDHWNDLRYVSIDYSLLMDEIYSIKNNQLEIEDEIYSIKNNQLEIEGEIYSIKNNQLEIEDELKFTQIAVIMVIIMNIVLVCALLCILYA